MVGGWRHRRLHKTRRLPRYHIAEREVVCQERDATEIQSDRPIPVCTRGLQFYATPVFLRLHVAPQKAPTLHRRKSGHFICYLNPTYGPKQFNLKVDDRLKTSVVFEPSRVFQRNSKITAANFFDGLLHFTKGRSSHEKHTKNFSHFSSNPILFLDSAHHPNECV